MKIAVLKETLPGETRVAAVPATVRDYVRSGLAVGVEAGAGLGAMISDEQFAAAGASVESDARALLASADLVLRVAPPRVRDDGLDEIAAIKRGGVLVGMLELATAGLRLEKLAAAGVTAFAMELVPRITRAQSLDALSSMSTIAGYKAVLIAADALKKMMPMMMTAAGTIQPCSFLVIGAGVAGLQAVATARRLGATVKAVDTRPAVKEQVESLGAKFIHLEVPNHKAETSGGYARDLGEEFYRHEQETIAPHLKDADAVITTALIPNRRAPLLITEAMVNSMQAGSVIVDLAIGAGGNCALSKADQRVETAHVTIFAPSNLPSMVSVHASQMVARNMQAFLAELVKDGQIKLDMDNEVLRAMLVTDGGAVKWPPAPQPAKDTTGALS